MSNNGRWIQSWSVSSDTSDKMYTVSIDRDGIYGCSCPSWKFGRKKLKNEECKHITKHVIEEEGGYIEDDLPESVLYEGVFFIAQHSLIDTYATIVNNEVKENINDYGEFFVELLKSGDSFIYEEYATREMKLIPSEGLHTITAYPISSIKETEIDFVLMINYYIDKIGDRNTKYYYIECHYNENGECQTAILRSSFYEMNHKNLKETKA